MERNYHVYYAGKELDGVFFCDEDSRFLSALGSPE
jgi:hypothetical protein